MAQRILVTGAAGFVGAYLCEALARSMSLADVVRLTSPTEQRDGHIPVDLLDRAAIDEVVATHKPDVVVHLAAQSSTSRGTMGGGGTWAVNVSGSLNLASAVASHCPQSTVLFASTSEVYGASFLRGPVGESSPVLPMTAYARSKYIAEGVLDAMLPASGRLIIARPFNHSGPGQQETFVLPSFAAQIARIEAGLVPPELRVGNIDVFRDFMDVRDVVEAYIALIERADALPAPFVCNIASGNVRSLRELVEIFKGLSRTSFEVVVEPARTRPTDIRVAQGDGGLLQTTTGWRPKIAVETLLETLLVDARQRHAAKL